MAESKTTDTEDAATMAMKPARTAAPSMTVRARRRREEAVRRLVAEIQSTENDWLVASTVATALEKGLDRDLHSELVQEAKDNAARIGQVCHDHADVFLTSVAQVAALGEPSADLADGIKNNHGEVQTNTAGPMHHANVMTEQARQSYARGKTLHIMVDACQTVAMQLERARKQAGLGRPRAALEAVDQARTALTTPMESLFEGTDRDLYKACSATETTHTEKRATLVNLEQTPFGTRASVMLPKIESEVLLSARRGLNRWFLQLRSGGDAAKAGRAVLRQCSHAIAVGPGHLGLGGSLPASYVWRAKTADNLVARLDQTGKVARAVRLGYYFDRDAPKEAAQLERLLTGQERRAEAIVAAFGFHRCWDENSPLLIDPAEWTEMQQQNTMNNSNSSHHTRTSSSGGSRHGGSRHGLSGSRHGLRGSRHGKGRSLGFRATTNSRSQAFQEISSTLTGGTTTTTSRSRWCEFLTPEMLNDKLPSR